MTMQNDTLAKFTDESRAELLEARGHVRGLEMIAEAGARLACPPQARAAWHYQEAGRALGEACEHMAAARTVLERGGGEPVGGGATIGG